MLIPLSEDNLSDKIIFNNNTGYLILMLGAGGYSPVVTPHRIKQVFGALPSSQGSSRMVLCWLARPMKFGVVAKLLWYLRIFACVIYSVVVLRAKHRSSPFIALMSAHRRKSMHRHKGKCNKKNMPSQYHQLSTQKGIDLTQIYPKGIEVPYWASEIR